VILQEFVDKGADYHEISFMHSKGVDILSKSEVLLVSLNLTQDDGISNELFLKNSASNVLKRLLEGKFLTVDEKEPLVYFLSSSAVAIVHQMVVKRWKRQKVRGLRQLLHHVKSTVGLSNLVDARGDEHLAAMQGRSIIDCIVQNPNFVAPLLLSSSPNTSASLEAMAAGTSEAAAAISEKDAVRLGQMLVDGNFLTDCTTDAFNMFSATHIYSLSLGLSLSGIQGEPSDPDILLSLDRNKAVEEGLLSPKSKSPTGRKEDEKVDWLVDYDASVIANSLIALDLEFLHKLDLTELDFTGWKKGHQTMQDWIAFFNRTSYLVASEIVTCPWPDERKSLLEKLISVAVLLKDAHNYQSLFAVVGGLSLNCVSRLTDVWDKMDTRRTNQWEMLKALTASKNNFKEYRAALVSSSSDDTNGSKSSTIPYVGLLLQDILSIEEIPTFVASSTDEVKLLNFDRLRKLGMGKSILKRAQDSASSAQADADNNYEHVAEYLISKGVALDRDVLYLLSLKIQSRDKRKKRK